MKVISALQFFHSNKNNGEVCLLCFHDSSSQFASILFTLTQLLLMDCLMPFLYPRMLTLIPLMIIILLFHRNIGLGQTLFSTHPNLKSSLNIIPMTLTLSLKKGKHLLSVQSIVSHLLNAKPLLSMSAQISGTAIFIVPHIWLEPQFFLLARRLEIFDFVSIFMTSMPSHIKIGIHFLSLMIFSIKFTAVKFLQSLISNPLTAIFAYMKVTSGKLLFEHTLVFLNIL